MQKDTKDEMKVQTRIEYERANYKKDWLDYSNLGSQKSLMRVMLLKPKTIYLQNDQRSSFSSALTVQIQTASVLTQFLNGLHTTSFWKLALKQQKHTLHQSLTGIHIMAEVFANVCFWHVFVIFWMQWDVRHFAFCLCNCGFVWFFFK